MFSHVTSFIQMFIQCIYPLLYAFSLSCSINGYVYYRWRVTSQMWVAATYILASNCPSHIFFSVQSKLTKFHVSIHPRTMWCVPRVYHCDLSPTLHKLFLTYRRCPKFTYMFHPSGDCELCCNTLPCFLKVIQYFD